MSQTTTQDLNDVSETLLITLYIRAMESQRPDALLKDEKAVTLVKKIRDDGLHDFGRIKSLHLSEANKLVFILRNREFDLYARDFLARHPHTPGQSQQSDADRFALGNAAEPARDFRTDGHAPRSTGDGGPACHFPQPTGDGHTAGLPPRPWGYVGPFVT